MAIPDIGRPTFSEHCALCHGVDAKGASPADPALKRAPTDLTSKRNGGKYPLLAVQQRVKGGEILDADVRVYALMQY